MQYPPYVESGNVSGSKKMVDPLRSARVDAIARHFYQSVPEGSPPMELKAMQLVVEKIAELLTSLDPEPAEPSYRTLVNTAIEEIRHHRIVFSTESVVELNAPKDPTGTLPSNWLAEGSDWSTRGYWRRYKTWLSKDRSPSKLQSLEKVTDNIIGRLGNPDWSATQWDRRGVVVGQVQSGKTEAYIGVIAKAIDSGYKTIVVLAGIHNDLRAQTQSRIDKGIIGHTILDNEQFLRTAVGVGLLPPFQGQVEQEIIPMTSGRNDGDFSNAVAKRYTNPETTHIFVVKKNVTVLKRMNDFFSTNNRATALPFLLLDDECDQASVNTNEDNDPTKTNREIRNLLGRFSKSAYVGFTATPFANIFIHPDAATKEHGADLFPKDFIHRLKPSNEYFGPEKLFGVGVDISDDEVVETPQLVVQVDDWDTWIAPRHKRTFVPGPLPETLLQALADFVAGAAIKRLRYGTPSQLGFDPEVGQHVTMLIHVTRFVDVQKLVTAQIKDEVKLMRSDLIGGSAQPASWTIRLGHAYDRLAESSSIMKTTLNSDEQRWAVGKDFDKRTVLTQIRSMLDELEVCEVNGTIEDGLKYDTAMHRFLVAIGGDKLSRGLTLEGLTISYFLRSAGTWDTLMQMGRWFGYRPGYLDLCRVYMPTDLSNTYEQITRAISDLSTQFDTMAMSGDTPSSFGFRLPKLASGQLPTRKGAMQHAEVKLETFHSETLLERLYFPISGAALDRVRDSLTILFEECSRTNRLISLGRGNGDSAKKGFRGISPATIAAFLNGADLPPSGLEESNTELCKYLEAQAQQDRLIDWTVAFIGRRNAPDKRPHLTLGQTEIIPVMRRTHGQQSSSHRRLRNLSSSDDEVLDLTDAEREIAEQLRQQESVTLGFEVKLKREHLRRARNPQRALLLCYPVVSEDPGPSTPIGVTWAISFPRIEGEIRTEYYITPAELRRRVGIDDEAVEDANE